MLYPQTSVVNVSGAGKMFEDHDNNCVYAWCYNDADPNSENMVIGVRHHQVVRFWSGQDHIHLWGLILEHGSHAIVNVDNSAADSNEFRHCTFRFWGGYDGENSSAWLSQQISNDSTLFNKYCLVQACSLYCGMADPGKWRMYVHTLCTYATHRLIVDSCVLHSAGIGVKLKDRALSEQCYGRRVSFCTIYNMDRPEGSISWEGHHVSDSVFGCVVYNNAWGIHDMGSYASGGFLQGKSFICNNTIYDCKEVAMSFCDSDRDADTTGGLGKGNIVKHNVVYGNHLSGDSEAMGFRYTSALSQSLFAADGGAIDSNMYYDNLVNSSSDAWHIYYSGTTYRDWTNWRDPSKYEFDQNGIDTVDPGFTAPASYDFSRPNACQEMDMTYGGRTWYVYGAWQPADPPFPCGDVTDDCLVDIDDITFLIAYVFNGGPSPDPLESGDVNCSGGPTPVDIDDVVYLIDYVFLGGSEPCEGC